MDILKESQLFKSGGDKKSGQDALAGNKVVLIYFSAHWCPPCRAFTPVLKDFYNSVKKQNVSIEVVFVSSDASVDDQISYMKESHGDWWAVENGADQTHQLKRKFDIKGIPSVIVLRASDGSLISADGRGEIQAKGEKAAEEWMAKV